MTDKSAKKKVGIGVLAGITSVAVLLGGVFDSSSEILNGYIDDSHIVIQEDEQNEAKPAKKSSFNNKVKELVYKVPIGIRTVVFVPLWFLGSAILYGFDLLVSTVIAPFAHIILGFLLQALIMLGIVAVCIKILFPDLPWRKIFSKKLILSVLIGSLVLSICDWIIPMFWEKYRFYRLISKFILGGIVILIILKPFIKKKLNEPPKYEIVYEDKVLG